jgi:glucosamine--fructose-6-phosphate aminotransferase (isomerizing)
MVVALVNVADSPLAQLADTVIPLHAGPENSVAATKSYLCSLGGAAADWPRAGAAIAALRAARRAAERMRAAWQQDWSPLVDGLRTAPQPVRARPRPRPRRGAGSGAEVQGNLRPARRGVFVGRGEARADGDRRPGFPVLAFAQDDDTGAGTARGRRGIPRARRAGVARACRRRGRGSAAAAARRRIRRARRC